MSYAVRALTWSSKRKYVDSNSRSKQFKILTNKIVLMEGKSSSLQFRPQDGTPHDKIRN
jgi:hypothetical protein